eukprot:gene15625-17202_t
MDRDNAAADVSKGGRIKKGRILDPDRCLTDVLELTLPSKKKLMKKNVKREIVVEYARDSETGKRVISNPRRHGDRKKQKSQLENNENMTTSFPEHQLCMEIDSEGSHKDAEHILENNEKDLKAMISECEKLTLSQKDKSESSKWTDRLEKASAMWEKHRNYIAECALEIESFSGSLNICENCNVKNPEIRCLDCADSKFLCISCDELVHEKFPLHDRDGWVDGFYKPLLPSETKDAASANIIHIDRRPVLHSKKCPKCKSSELECQIVDEDCIIVTVKDREEALTEFMMAWNKRKILKLPKDLCTRYLKTNKELLIVSEKIESSFKEMSITETDAEVHSWIEEIKLLASVDHSVETDATLSEKAEYILLAAMSKEDQQVQVLPELQQLPVPLISKLRFKDIPSSKTGRVSRLTQLSEKYYSFDDSFHTAHGELIMCIIDMVKRQIEKMCYNMSHYSFLIKKIADRSKWRHVLRKLISKEKATLSLCIDSYESCLQLNDPCSVMTKKIKEDILAGNFPWRRVHELSGNVDIADKRLIVQWCLVRDRLSEEKNIIIKEMHSYLSYYKDVVMPNLEKEQRDIAEGLWNCLGSDSNKDNHQEDNKMRYQPADLRKDVLSGIHAVLSRGRAFAAQKISDGMFWFKKIFAEVSSCSEGPTENLPSSFTREIKLLSRQYFSEESSDSETDNDFINENEDDTDSDEQFISNDSNIDND